MTLIEIFEESADVLRTNKLRTALSVLGIIIGIGSVIALVSLGQASQQSVQTRIQSLGANLLTIRPGAQQQGFVFGQSSATTLSSQDALAIKTSNRVTTVDKVAMEYSSRAQVVYKENNANVSVAGIDGDYFTLRNIELLVGGNFQPMHNATNSKVVILGNTTATDLFESPAHALGQSINIDGQSFEVIGVTKSKGGNIDETAFVPLSTAQKVLFGVDNLSTIYVGAKSEELMSAAQNQVGFLLLERHKLKSPEDADFTIFSQEDLLETASEVMKTFTTLLSGIAAISLVVGGVGIMNIMLVTVTERTSEIGLRKALGAKKKTVVWQFLVESIMLTFAGGVLGVMLGLVVSGVVTRTMDLPSVISIPSILIAVVVSSVIGVIFGLYPALKASKLQPIEALRYE